MKGFSVMLKANLKLLIRNKGYLCCVFLFPIFAVLMMNMKGNFGAVQTKDKYEVMEWNQKKKIISLDNTKLCVKVYDKSNAKESKELIEKLVNTGFYKLYMVNEEKEKECLTYSEIEKKAKSTFETCSIRAILYIPSDFTSILRASNVEQNEAVKVIRGYQDDRIALLQSDVDWFCSCIKQSLQDDTFLAKTEKMQMTKQVTTIKQSDEIVLDDKQQNYRFLIGYAIIFMSMSFILSGVFIIGIVIKERENNAYSRLRLSLMSNYSYIGVKLILTVITTVIQVLLFDIGLRITGRTEFGVPYYGFLGMLFLLGILFNMISLIIGLIINNLIGVTFASFTIWCGTSLMSGLYFPVIAGSKLEKVAMFTPQRWLIISTEMYMVNRSGAFLKFLLIFLAFLIVLVTIGMVALRTTEKE